MYKIPKEFSEIPEAKRLRQAEMEFAAACEEAKRLTQSSKQKVHLVYKEPMFEPLRKAEAKLKKAHADFDFATGEPKPVGLTPAVLEEISKYFSTDQRQQIIELLDQKCGRTIPFKREASAKDLEYTRICVLRLSKGNLVELHKWIELANIDERDLYSAASPLMEDFRKQH
jgi:hypothetical protein